jgi:ribosome recycling factor
MLKEMKSEKEISEDQMRKVQERVQKTTDEYIAKVDAVAKEKEQEIMEI